MSTTLPFETIAEERRQRLKSRADGGVEAGEVLSRSLSLIADPLIVERVVAAYEYARSLEYGHPGLSSASYMAHPVRVASMAIRLVRPVDENAVVLALLHNVFEHTSVAHQEIAIRFGRSIADAIRLLTVDRAQVTREYTAGYYAALQDAPRWVRVVKLLDKLDNLFVLGLNPDGEVRRAYLADIEQYIVPMARADLPALTDYLATLIDDCRSVGFLTPKTTT